MPAIRVMIQDDLDGIARLERATPEAPQWTRSNYEEFLSDSIPPKRIFVAEIDGNLAGFIAARIVAGVCELESIVVDRRLRRGGVGSKLLSTLLEWAARNGVVRVELEVRDGNNTAIDFYTTHNFRIDGRRTGYYRDPDEDALLLSCSLKQG